MAGAHGVVDLAGGQAEQPFRRRFQVLFPGKERQRAHRRDEKQEADDQRGDGAAQVRFGGQEPLIGRRGDEARMSGETNFVARPAPGKEMSRGRAPRVR
jgi:hypothetical protein